jgi:predicted RNA-binding protein with PIN domain
MPFIIDGHNLRWSIREVGPVRSNPLRSRGGRDRNKRASNGAGEDFEAITDLQLCHIVGRYLGLIGEKGEIVFDGTGPPDKSGFDNINNLEVSFAGLTGDADTVIEDKIRASTAPRRLTVVSSDRRLKAAARARKAAAVKSDVFWTNLQKRLGQSRTIKEPPAKRCGISESETKQWLEFFGLEQ